MLLNSNGQTIGHVAFKIGVQNTHSIPWKGHRIGDFDIEALDNWGKMALDYVNKNNWLEFIKAHLEKLRRSQAKTKDL